MGIYFDNAATTFPKPEEVYGAVDHYLREVGASVGRGAYCRALEAGRIVVAARSDLARLLQVADPSRIVFTSNATESLNLALKGFLRPGDTVVTSSMEHNAVWRPLKRLEREQGVRLVVVRCREDGSFPLEGLEQALVPGVRLVAVTHASNVTGTLLPVAEIGHMCHRHDAALLVDAAQTSGAYPIAVEDMEIDFLAFTGHKALFGPPGTGGLYVAPSFTLLPLKEGGTGTDSLSEQQPEVLPEGLEAGTLNTAGIAGLGAGVRFILERGLASIRRREEKLTATLLEELRRVPGVTIYGPADPARQVGVVSFNLAGVTADVVAYLLDTRYNIMTRSGLHCAPQAHRTIGTLEMGTVRVGLSYFNTEEEIKMLGQALREILQSR